MEHLTPAELLRFLEEEANTLQLMNAKIANQLHCLQVEEELFSRQLSNLEKGKERASGLLVGSVQSEQDVNGNRDNEDNFENEIRSEGVERHSPALYESTAQVFGSNPKFLESPETRTSLGAGKQEPSETIELENDHDMETEFQDQQEQEVLNVEEPSAPQLTIGRRIYRRPARLQD